MTWNPQPQQGYNMFKNKRHKSAQKSVVAGRHLRREIALMLAIKALLLFGIWHAFFSEPQVPKMTEGMNPDRVAANLFSSIQKTTTPNP
jgi:hypothetical protein